MNKTQRMALRYNRRKIEYPEPKVLGSVMGFEITLSDNSCRICTHAEDQVRRGMQERCLTLEFGQGNSSTNVNVCERHLTAMRAVINQVLR